MVDKIESICRTCLTESTQCVSIYESTNDYKYNELLNKFVGLEIRQQDNLPSVICDICSAELTTVVNFISKCRSSDEKLKEALDLNIPFKDFISKNIREVPIELICVSTIKNEVDDSNDDCLDFDDRKKESDFKKTKKKKSLKEIICQVCGLKKTCRSALIAHSRIHSGDRPFLCSCCNKTFNLKGALKEHMKRHSKDDQTVQKNYICDFCGQRFYRKSVLKVHLRIHTKEKPYQCKYCPRSFSQISTHIQHTRLHTGDNPFPCHVCEKKFKTSSSLRKHLVSHTTEKNFTCHICNKALKTRASLKTHIKHHTSEDAFSCNKCDKSFKRKMSLQRHVLGMHSELAGSCDICKKEYSNINVHNRSHNGERPFECSVCKKKFSRENYLKMHFKLHSEPTKFSCKEENCDAAFPFKEQLKVHEYKVHGSYFPYACKICSKGYYRKSDLGKHKLYGNCMTGNIKKEKIP